MATATLTQSDLERRVLELEARNAELQQQLDLSEFEPQQETTYPVVMTGLIKNVREFDSQPDMPTACVGWLRNSRDFKVGEWIYKVDLPDDRWIARDYADNTVATEILQIAASTQWALVRLSGTWSIPGKQYIKRNERKYLVSSAKQLDVRKVELIKAEWLQQEEDPFDGFDGFEPEPTPAAASAPARVAVPAGPVHHLEPVDDGDVPF